MKTFLIGALAFAAILGALTCAYLVFRPAIAQAPDLMSDRNPRGGSLESVLQTLTQRQGQRQSQPQANEAPAITTHAWPLGSSDNAQPEQNTAPLPDAPLVSEQQQQQLDFAAELAAQEASQEYLESRRQAEEAAPIKMDAAEAAQEYGRDPCHAPRADPRTCSLGIPEATPLNQP